MSAFTRHFSEKRTERWPHRASIEAVEPTPVEVIAFSGGENFGLVASIAADLEREGRKPDVRWTRDVSGLIDGIAIFGVPR